MQAAASLHGDLEDFESLLLAVHIVSLDFLLFRARPL